MFDRLLLTALEHREVRPVQDEVLVDELQHGYLMPCLRIHGYISGADWRMQIRTDRTDQMVDPSGRKARDCAVRGHRSVVRCREHAVDELFPHSLHRSREDLLVEDTDVAA